MNYDQIICDHKDVATIKKTANAYAALCIKFDDMYENYDAEV